MTDITEILTRIDQHIAQSGAARSTVSRKLFGNGNRLDEIQKGGTLTLRKLKQVEQSLAELESQAA